MSAHPKKRTSQFDMEAYRRFISEFTGESDRAAVILGAAKLDSLLAQILDRFLMPSLSSDDELLEGDSPLSSFSARINACYRLGLIRADFAKALHTVRRIRNSFAHDISGCSLDSGPQSDRVKSLLIQLRPLPFFQAVKERFVGGDDSCSTEFKTCLALMTARLEWRLIETQQIVGEPWAFIKKAWSDEEITSEDGPQAKV